MIALVRKWLRWMEVDRAVSYGVMASSVQLVAAPVTILLIVWFLTPEMQGFYYTFAALIALQGFLELGLTNMVINTASHEWTHLSLDEKGRIVGNPDALSRVVSLGRLIFKWYGTGHMLFVAAVGVGGYVFLSQQSVDEVTWVGPWWFLVVLSGLALWAVPFIALLEGCDQVATIQKFRLAQQVLRYVVLWTMFLVGGELWSAAAGMGATVLSYTYLLGVRYRRFFKPFFSRPASAIIPWRTELLPLQWRLAVSTLFRNFLVAVFSPVMFHYHGAVVAGQMGMTMSAVFAVGALVAAGWLPPKVPRFGMLVARRDYTGLDQLWWHTTRASMLVSGAGAFGIWLVVYGINVMNVSLAERMLPPLPTALLLIPTVITAVSMCERAYLQAHKQEPMVVVSVVTSLLMTLLVWTLGSRFGPIGAATAYLIVTGGVNLPWETLIWFRKRAEWHRTDSWMPEHVAS